MTLKEGSAPMSLHEELDGRFFLCFAAENLGDDAFEFAAVAFVNEPGTPGNEGIRAGDQPGQARDTALNKLARLNRLAIRLAESAPREHAREKNTHVRRGAGAEREAAQVEAVICDRQAVARLWFEKILLGHPELVEFE